MKKNEIVLKYIGHGSLIQIPARDLTQADLDDFAWTGWDLEQLVGSGLYQPVQEKEPAKQADKKRGEK